MKFLTFFLMLSLSSFATEHDSKKTEMMEKFKAYSTPGKEHKVLAGMAGRWSYTSKWWESADAKPQESKGTSHFKMIMGGRFLEHTTKGKSMGGPFEGLGLTGYDNLKQKFDTIWIDNMGTGIVHGEGSFNEANQTLTDNGEFSCPMTETKKSTYRGEWKLVDKNNMIYTMYGKGMENKEEFKMMEMTFKRMR